MKAKLQMILACVAFGTLGLFVKAIPLPSAEIALYRALIALFVIFLVLLCSGGLKKDRLALLRGKLLRLFLSGIAMGFNWILLFEAYNHTSIALSTLCYYFAPAIVTIISIFLFREKLNAQQWICSAASLAGLALIIGVSGGGRDDLVGALFGLGSAALYASVVLFNKSLRETDGVTRSFVQFAAAAIVLVPYCALTGGFHFHVLRRTALWSMLLVGVVHSGVMYCLYFSALGTLRGQQSAVLSYIDPLVAVLISAVFLHEPVTPLQLIGGAVILLSTLFNELDLRKIRQKNQDKFT